MRDQLRRPPPGTCRLSPVGYRHRPQRVAGETRCDQYPALEGPRQRTAPQARDPKAESRMKPEIRNPKLRFGKPLEEVSRQMRKPEWCGAVREAFGFRISGFGFRPSDFRRPSPRP